VFRTLSFLSHADCFRISRHRLLLSDTSLLLPIISFPFPPTHPILVAAFGDAGRPALLNANLITHSELQAPTSVKFSIFTVCPGLGPRRRRKRLISPASCTQWWQRRRYKPLAKIGLGSGEIWN
jgi:hypothetical protein